MPVLGSRGGASSRGFGGLANLGYLIKKSLRFRSASSAYLTRTPGSAGNRQKFTFSAWVKKSGLTSRQGIFAAGTGNTGSLPGGSIYFDATTPTLSLIGAGGTSYVLTTTQIFRDPSAWYHIVVAFDTTQSTDTNKIKLYVNGSQITSFSSATYPSLNFSTDYNNTAQHNIGARADDGGTGNASTFLDGYMAEVYMIDGQQLTPSSFGKNDATTGQWIPKKYTGTYGTNGFYLTFNDASAATAAAIGKDSSGNGNNFTPSAISLSADTNYDSMRDVPTLTNSLISNYATLNPLSYPGLSSYLTRGNLSLSGQDQQWAMATVGVNLGKWYWEVYVESNTYPAYLGVINAPFRKDNPDTSPGINTASMTSYIGGLSSGTTGYYKNYTAGSSSSQTGLVQNKTWGFALDLTAGTLNYYVDNSLVHTDSTLPTDNSTYFFPMVGQTNTGSNSWTRSWFNFGQQPFAFTPPAGYFPINAYNLP